MQINHNSKNYLTKLKHDIMKARNYREGFELGFSQLKLADVSQARLLIMKALNINNRNSFFNYKTGKTEVKASQAVKVESVFLKFGIKQIWGK